MATLRKIQVTRGVFWIEAAEAGMRILCGCPADSVKHLMRRGFIAPTETEGVPHETGPNAILLSDVQLQGGVFANLAEFPVLQMLYRQGLILPNHPNNTGEKPLLIGSESQVRSQMEYIYRGNYGLVSREELLAAGATPEFADTWMRLKLRFAFGTIRSTEELLDACVVGDAQVEIRNGLFIRRLAVNVFEFSCEGKTVTVDLNLPPGTSYEAPYHLGHKPAEREYFAVLHCGEGDGWDVNRPCMGSVLMFQGRIYLIDAGPNILHSLNALGIGVNEIEGVFHTHAHDDHFNGLTTLMRADHKLKYYATPLVRASVTKKLAALAGIAEDDFGHYFHVHDLVEGKWNDVESLEVKPIDSPHPVENTVFIFRALGGDGYRTYGHFADIVSLDVLRGFIDEDTAEPGVSRAFYEKTQRDYLQELDIKKLDIGGGLIHGDAEDFKDDPTDKIILAHTALPLNSRQRELGSGAPFGMVDVLIPAYQDYLRRYAFHYLAANFPGVPKDHILALSNSPVRVINPETILVKAGEEAADAYLVLTGSVEMLGAESGVLGTLSAGAIVGEFAMLTGEPARETYRAIDVVRVLCIPSLLYSRFIERNALMQEMERLHAVRSFLMRTQLFGEGVSFPVLNRIAALAEERTVAPDTPCAMEGDAGICIVRRGELQCVIDDVVIDTVTAGEFVGETTVLYDVSCAFTVQASKETVLYHVPARELRDIPVVRWTLFATYKRRTELTRNPTPDGGLFRWRADYDVGVGLMDEDHRRFFEIAGNLHQAIGLGHSHAARRYILDALVQYAGEHFAREEAFMEQAGYPGLGEHMHSHARLMEWAHAQRDRVVRREIAADMEFVSLVKDWIINHVMAEDTQFAAFYRARKGGD